MDCHSSVHAWEEWRRDGSELTVSMGKRLGAPSSASLIYCRIWAKIRWPKAGGSLTGEDLNILAGSLPGETKKGEQLFKLNVMKILNEQYGIVEEDLISAELEFVPAFLRRTSVLTAVWWAPMADDRVCLSCLRGDS